MVGDRHDKWYMTEPRVILILLLVLPRIQSFNWCSPSEFWLFLSRVKTYGHALNTSVAHFIIKPFKCLHIDHSLGTWFPLLHPSIPHSSLQMLSTSLVPPSLKLSPLIPLISSLLVRPLQTQEGRYSQTYMHCMLIFYESGSSVNFIIMKLLSHAWKEGWLWIKNSRWQSDIFFLMEKHNNHI